MNKGDIATKLQQIKILADELVEEIGSEGRANSSIARKRAPQKTASSDRRPSFDLNALAFMKRYAREKSGPQKATLLLARLAKGSTSHQVSASDLQKSWNKMTSIMGGSFNPAYMNRAKANGWVDAPKYGMYALASGWKETLS